MLKVLIQRFIHGDLGIWTAAMAWFIEHSERARVELAQQESLEDFLKVVRAAHQHRGVAGDRPATA